MKEIDNYISRQESVVTGERNLEVLHTLEKFPVFFGCVTTPESDDLTADMVWAIDPETGVIQLTKLIPLDILYQSQHVDGCGATWNRYYHSFAKYLLKHRPRNVLEIGGGQGQLAEIATEKDDTLRWMILEPNPTHPGNEQIEIVEGFFDDQFRLDKEVDCVVFSQLLEHIYDPKDFLESISKFLKPGGKLVFAYPNLTLWLKRKYTNAINFEHTMFLTSYFVDYLLKLTGFDIEDKRRYKDHSYYYTAVKRETPLKEVRFKNRYREYKKIFMDFIRYHQEMVADINNKIRSADQPVYCFGAHIFTTFLLAFGLNREKIISILDNSPTKQGKRLYGTSFMVESPKVLAGKGKVNVILKAGIYNEEIMKDILENINPDVTFW